MEYTTHSESETEALGESLAQKLRAGDVVALYGDLGAGKTAFVRGMARGLNSPNRVTSPTFTIVQFYEGPRLKVAHFDLYRLSSADEAYEIGLDEALDDGAAVIEWPERLEGHLPPDRLDVEIVVDESPDGGEARRARLIPAGAWEGRGLEFRS